MADTLEVQWTDHTGFTWDLTTGEDGVLLDMGQEGIGLSAIEQSFSSTGRWQGAVLKNAEPSLRLIIGDGLTGEEYYALADRWWSLANSAHEEGVLRFTRPGQAPRELRCRLRATPDTTFTFDPGADFHAEGDRSEAWLLVGTSPFWSGETISETFSLAQVGSESTRNGTPFFGPAGHGWPLYISQPTITSTTGTARITNSGDGPMWPEWSLTGPMRNVRVGFGDYVLAYDGAISSTETIVIRTDPARRDVFEASSKESRYGLVTGTYAPIPAGHALPLVTVAEGMTQASKIRVWGRAQHRRPF